MKNHVVIIGGTGSLGRELVKFYDGGDFARKITVFSTDPHKQISLANSVSHRCKFVLGDVRDPRAVQDVVSDADIVIHAAALKHVDLGEVNISEFLSVNVDGANNVALACKNIPVEKALFISSDKAVEPINFYGKTKSIGEDIFLSNGFSVLRYGNVVNSNGSFLKVWKAALELKKPIVLRVPDPTRFYLEICHAVELVHSAITEKTDGLFVPATLRSFSINSAFDSFERLCGSNMFGITRPRLTPGEKQHEVLLAEYENGHQINDILCMVHKGIDGDLKHDDFCSKTAQRMTDEEIDQFVLHTIQ